ncbi:MAG: 30S ribosomal protein S9 [Patescibacteria group bacterium]|jgi:small subunit ribosomal protein S9
MTKLNSKEQKNRAVGRRKSAAARVRIDKGTGKIVVNGKPADVYFGKFAVESVLAAPLKALGKEKDLDFSIKVAGGGKKGQLIACQHGIARALVVWNEDFHKTLKTLGLLTRDARIKERKKFGLKKARRAPQWSKR